MIGPHPVQISIPALSLVVLIGPSGAGKSTFARAHFKPTVVLSSDAQQRLLLGEALQHAAGWER